MGRMNDTADRECVAGQEAHSTGPGAAEPADILDLALCHLSDLIGLAHEIACDMHGQVSQQEALQVSGRLATLMHCAAREIVVAQKASREMSHLP